MSITATNILEAHDRIRPYIHQTPVLTCQTLDRLTGSTLFFKCENFQKIGAFKIRGGMNAALSLDAASLQKGLATHSSGNHAQAIAYAARVLGTQAFIVMPNNSPKVKVDAVSGYGAEITFCEPNQEARELTLKQVLDRTGATFIHPYNDERVITGQATCVKELIEQVNGLDIVIAPVGGGGLLSGTSLGIHYFSPQTKVYAGEPEGAADAVLSFRTGKIEKAPFINTIADGLLTSLGNLTLPIIRQGVTDILTVSDQEIIDSLRLVYERMKIVVEPSCVVTLAAVLRYPDIFKKKRVGLILTGGNVDLTKLSGWFSSGKGVQ